MPPREGADSVKGAASDALRSHAAFLGHWLREEAYPLWAGPGFDERRGCFQELLDDAGPVVAAPRRARVQVRQIYAYARAAGFGWRGDATRLIARTWEHFVRCYQRPDGLFRCLLAADDTILDERAWLYDQAFVLLALAETRRMVGPVPKFDALAAGLRSGLHELLRHAGPGFLSGNPVGLPLLANPHMHLLEATQAWLCHGPDEGWQALADELVALALDRLIDPVSGALFERFDSSWQPLQHEAESQIEPGHHYEWAWLLARVQGPRRPEALAAAARLVELAEAHGLRAGLAVMALHADLSVADDTARLWAQTERLKGALALARLGQGPQHWRVAELAAGTIIHYLRGDAPGLWWDRVLRDGRFVKEPSPASTFYHLVCAIDELHASLAP